MNPGPKSYERWFGKVSYWTAIAALLIAFLHPPHDLGLRVCWLKESLHVSCPGCGLTRSMSCTARGMFAAACDYHPFGPVLFAVFIVVAAMGSVRGSARRHLQRWVAKRSVAVDTLYLILVASFLAYGAIRAVSQISQSMPAIGIGRMQ